MGRAERVAFIAAMSLFIPIFLMFPGDQLCKRKGLILIWRLVIERCFNGAVDSLGYGFRYASMPNFRFYLLNVTLHRQESFLVFSLPLPLLTPGPLERQMDFLKQPCLIRACMTPLYGVR